MPFLWYCFVGSSVDNSTSSPPPVVVDMTGVTGTESRMKKALESMVQKLEKKIDTTEAALGEKMNRLLDTDRDGEKREIDGLIFVSNMSPFLCANIPLILRVYLSYLIVLSSLFHRCFITIPFLCVGEITFEEFTDALKKTLKRPISDHEAQAIAKLLDSDNDGKVEWFQPFLHSIVHIYGSMLYIFDYVTIVLNNRPIIINI